MDNLLTPAQEQALEEFKEEMYKVGTCIEPADRSKAEEAIAELYPLCFEIPPPEDFYWVLSPRATKTLLPKLKSKIERDFYSQMRHWYKRKGGMCYRLKAESREALGNTIERTVNFKLHSFLASDLIGLSIERLDPFNAHIPTYFEGQAEIHRIAHFCFFQDYLGVKYPPRLARQLSLLKDISSSCFWWWPFKEIVVLSERPCEVHLKDGQLHKEGGPALKFPSGWTIYSLNNVHVSKQIATKPWNELDPNLILTEKNAEVRREIVKKVGIERICEELGAKCIDRMGNYELLLLDLQDGRKRPFLKMRNPSIGIYHIEGVPPEIRTVRQALSWRNNSTEPPSILT